MLTVCLATHNGSKTLPTTLASFTRLVQPVGGWKLVVVDNGSTDGTAQIIESYQSKLPLLYLNQAKPGKNAALNLAVPHFEGDLIVFTDDDVVADPEWLVCIRQVADQQPGYDLFGGVIRPLWPTEPPEWLMRAVPIRVVYAVTAEDLEDGPVHPGRIWGPNMAVRSRVFSAGHRFDENVGPQPGQYRMGSETEFTTRLAAQGHNCWHCSACRVQHIIRPHQMEPRWVAKRGFRFGRDMFWKENDPALSVAAGAGGPRAPLLFGLPRWYFGKFLAGFWDVALGKIAGDTGRWLQGSWEVEYWRGYFAEAFGAGKHVRRPPDEW